MKIGLSHQKHTGHLTLKVHKEFSQIRVKAFETQEASGLLKPSAQPTVAISINLVHKPRIVYISPGTLASGLHFLVSATSLKVNRYAFMKLLLRGTASDVAGRMNWNEFEAPKTHRASMSVKRSRSSSERKAYVFYKSSDLGCIMFQQQALAIEPDLIDDRSRS
jgi:hypothetical protein